MASNVKQTPIPVVPRTMKIVNPDGTPTRSGQLLLQQVPPANTASGAHADRPAPGDMPDNAIWIDTDRGVIYQNQGGNWQYVAGTMYGTLAPDERPTDLGVYDGGFEFRANDTDPTNRGREFIWSQTAWVENTEVLYGAHAGRPAPADAPARCIYVEDDRGVIYQNQLGVWEYLAGTMWGTFSPDQRPTDLGVHDAGFTFRTTDEPPREFIWSQTEWVEIEITQMVFYGTHAGRPAPADAPDGCIYVEDDRGVIYQNQLGVWEYLAGTMWGTFSPDQRPTDLGVHDAGFTFRTTDEPPREFIWSQTEWVEIEITQMVFYGTHAGRPAPADAPDGAIYVEDDRGVIYQNQIGVWEYLAGTMWGTLSPDQRPTDLGLRDAGFTFRTTELPPREFVWSQTAWVETTAPVRYDTHANRPAPTDAPDGMIYVEDDRGAMYQNQIGVWEYLAGIMWGTLSPDQRPTDLGLHDAGFTFRTNVAPPREFIWNQTAWVETTPHPQTPWASNIDAFGFNLSNAGKIGIGAAPTYPLDVVGYAGSSYTGGCARFSGSTSVSESGIHIVNTQPSGRDYAFWSTGSGSSLGPGCFIIADATAGATRICMLASGNVGIGGLTSPSFQFQLAIDSAGKPGTSTWSVVSDIRLKQNIQPVKDDSLAILNKLNWVRYEYNGQADTTRGLKAIGLAAQELQMQLPEAVQSVKTKLNKTDAVETDVLAIDYHHIIVHSARAIQQLGAEVKSLKALIAKPQT